MKVVIAVAALGTLAGSALAEDFKSQTDRWNALLQKHVRTNGGVNYIGMDADQVELDAFLKGYEALDVKAMDDKARKAAYINLYNAGMIKNVFRYARDNRIDVRTKVFQDLKINDLKAPGGNIWNGAYKFKVAGVDVNLDNVEHDLLRGGGKGELAALKVTELDPRIHAAVNCAALSCPRVREVAYRAENVDTMLDENLKEFVSSDQQFAKVSDSQMRANSIVHWYYDDFDDYAQDKLKLGGAGDYLAGFVQPKAQDRDWKVKHFKDSFNDRSKLTLKLSSAFAFAYDWRINDVRNK